MGSLALPASGIIYLDSSSFIYSVEKVEPFSSLLDPLWLTARSGDLQIQSSELALLEVLVKPRRDKDTMLESSFRSLLLSSREVHLVPITKVVLDLAVDLRATTNIRIPDAIHAATALIGKCALLVTNDVVFRRVPGLQVTVLREVIAA